MLLFRTSVDYLGRVLLIGRLAVTKDSTFAIVSPKFGWYKTQLGCFLVSFNVFYRFTKDFSHIAEPLNRWLQKDPQPEWDNAPGEQRWSIDTLNSSRVNPLVLKLPVANLHLILHTDSSVYQLRVTLFQQ